MSTVRLNITLPSDLGQKVKQQPNSSAVIAASLREHFRREEKALLESQLAEGYQKRAETDRQEDREFVHTLKDGS